jgi:hypothetical protein
MCLSMVRESVRRWGVYIAIAACIAGVGAPALAVWSVLPLFWSLKHSIWTVPTLLMYTGLLALIPWAMRSLLWPPEWAEVERSLPVPRVQTLVSDLEMIALALLPVTLILSTGAGIALSQNMLGLGVDKPAAISALLAVLTGSIGIALGALQGLRRAGRTGESARKSGQAVTMGPPSVRVSCGWFHALIWAPVIRSSTRRTVHSAVVGFVGLCAIAVLTAQASDWARWGLAGFAALALMTVSRVNALSRQEFGEVLSQCAQLPLDFGRLERAREWLVMVPAVAGLIVLLIVTADVAMRTSVWWAFVAASFAFWWIEVRWRIRDPSAQAARWFVLLAISIALGTESIA